MSRVSHLFAGYGFIEAKNGNRRPAARWSIALRSFAGHRVRYKPNTAARVYKELELEAYALPKEAKEPFVTEDPDLIRSLKEQTAKSIVKKFIKEMTGFRVWQIRDYSKYRKKETKMILLKTEKLTKTFGGKPAVYEWMRNLKPKAVRTIRT